MNSALLALKRKGYQVWYDERAARFCCERDGWDFTATNPCSLLGLAALYEHVGPKVCSEYWWKLEGPDLFGSPPLSPSKFESASRKAAERQLRERLKKR